MSTSAQASSPQDAIVRCPQCGKSNRLAGGPNVEATCGSCKQALFPPNTVKSTDATWAADVERSPIPVLVDFWAPWCGPCRAVGPVMEQIAKERVGKLKVMKLNVDDNPQTAAQFNVQAIPTMIVFKDGQVVEQIRGAMPKPAIDARLDRLGL